MDESKSKTRTSYGGLAGAIILGVVMWGILRAPQSTVLTAGSPPPSAASNVTTVDRSGAQAATTVVSVPVEIVPTETTDEAEFLLYCYENLRDEIPAAVDDVVLPISRRTRLSVHRLQAVRTVSRGDAQKGLTELRDRVNQYHEYAKQKGVDPGVQSLYADLLTAIDITADYLIQLNRIDRALLDLRARQSAETGYNTVLAGGNASHAAYENGAERGDAAFTGIATGMVTFFLEEMTNQQELDESKRQALEDASEDFKRKMSALQARESNGLSDFAKKYQWQRDKEGHSVDRFTKLEEDLTHQYCNASTPNEALVSCKAILDSARLVPGPSVYDEHRAYALYWAARAAMWAAEQELRGERWGSTYGPSADVAVKLWDAALRYAPTDPAGLWPSQRAWTLGIGGRFPEAIKQATEVFPLRQADPAFMYQYACLWSASGSPDQNTLLNLRTAISREGFSTDLFEWVTLQTMKKDPNLDVLRQRYSAEFGDLVELKYKWYVDEGLLSDDICLINNSAFPITNVKFVVSVKSVGYADWGPYQEAAARIEPGQTFRWPAGRTPRGNAPNRSALLTTDQNK